jgi:hypothetical protein
MAALGHVPACCGDRLLDCQTDKLEPSDHRVMSQTSVIFFFLLAGFVIFITARGELPQYLNVLTGK